MAGELVLIVEDNDRNLELVQDILELRGFRTLTATSGSEGVNLARQHAPDLVLMDVQLPDFEVWKHCVDSALTRRPALFRCSR